MLKKMPCRRLLFFGICIVLISGAALIVRDAADAARSVFGDNITIVIDPGHGAYGYTKNQINYC